MNKRHVINLLIILAIGIIAYFNSFSNDFVWEDRFLIKENADIKSLENIWRIFGKKFFTNDDGFNFYRPLATLSNMADYSVWGLNPFGYHLTNFILHLIAASLIYVLLFYFFKRYIAALFLSLIFITHPSATEAIAYIPGRADPLAFIFVLLSFLSIIYFWGAKSKRWGYYALSIISFILACLAKETAAVFPIFLLLYSLTADAVKKDALKNKILLALPYFSVTLAILSLRYLVLKGEGSGFAHEAYIGLYTRLINVPLLIFRYVWMFIFPRPFVFDEVVTFYARILSLPVTASFILFIAAVLAIIKFHKSKMAIGAMWFLTFIFPVSGIVPINAFLYHHWLYIPSLGLLIILADLICKVKNVSGSSLALVGVAITASFCVLTVKQNSYFKDDIAFYKKTIERTPQSTRMHYNLGIAYAERGRMDDAIAEFREAVALRRDYVAAYVNLGYAYRMKDLNEEAEKTFKKAAEVAPNSYLPYYYLANLYNDTGQMRKSLEFYKKAISLKPANPDIYFDMGRAYDKGGNIQEAISAYQKTIELSASYIDAYVNLGAIFAQNGRLEEAQEIWERAARLKPDDITLNENLKRLKRIRK